MQECRCTGGYVIKDPEISLSDLNITKTYTDIFDHMGVSWKHILREKMPDVKDYTLYMPFIYKSRKGNQVTENRLVVSWDW